MGKNNPKVLFLVAHHGFRDKELTWVVERLDLAEIDYEIASSHSSEAEGRFGLVIQPDLLVTRAVAADYEAVVVVGEEEASEFSEITEAIKLIRRARELGLVVASIGAGVQLLIAANVIRSKKITGPAEFASMIEQAGGFFTGKLVEKDDNIITANGPYGVKEFAEEFTKVIVEDSFTSDRKFLR